eukprot:CAMPEP_0119414060 /NCGR_PEP_ID=MMETSP1335-20130426/6433_1 /TAXON_ID=259385 /ORGANISM="Chrysoculter rhomboideus, Strain RCC1486" /LENGTH=160 /DNA_ID=CAMNT_0007438911 /DNA_START=54 /DNA_END=536 /DNA_ORIENTATION=+
MLRALLTTVALVVAVTPADAALVGSRSAFLPMARALPHRSSRAVRRSCAPVAAVQDLKSEKELKKALNDAGDGLVVVDYSTSWCGPCKVIAPKFEEFSETYTSVAFYTVIGDSSSDANKLMSSQGIRAVPTFQLWKSKKKVCEISGAKAAALEEAIQANA